MSSFFSGKQVIAMMHIPVDSIIASTRSWRVQQDLPVPTAEDWRFIRDLINSGTNIHLAAPELRMLDVVESQCRSLSFYEYLEERMFDEVACYLDNGVDAVMLENVAPPYFSRETMPAVVPGVMGCLAEALRKKYPQLKIGIQVLAFADDQAMQIAVRKGLDFIRTESALFEGVRPEGRTPNTGNLAQLYMVREILAAECGVSDVPLVLVDLQKKHTVFSEELEDLELWLDSILFEKLEGIILTGGATGQQADTAQLAKTRAFIDSLKEKGYSLPLFVGSGVNNSSIESTCKYADGAIVGSAFKRDCFWENEVDRLRVVAFMEKWRQ